MPDDDRQSSAPFVRLKEPSVRRYRLALIGGLVVAGIVLHHAGVFDWYRVLDVAEGYAHRWWFAIAVVAVKAGLYAFAMPGSTMFWITGVLYPPPTATVILVVGGMAGSLGAFALARTANVRFDPRSRSARLSGLLRENSDLATLTALRTLPGFPHSILNYGCGMLGVPLGRFVISSLIGFTVKSYLYASAIRRAATAEEVGDVLGPDTLLPLIGLALLFVAGGLFHRRMRRRERTD